MHRHHGEEHQCRVKPIHESLMAHEVAVIPLRAFDKTENRSGQDQGTRNVKAPNN